MGVAFIGDIIDVVVVCISILSAFLFGVYCATLVSKCLFVQLRLSRTFPYQGLGSQIGLVRPRERYPGAVHQLVWGTELHFTFS